jgi:hypothetical protein
MSSPFRVTRFAVWLFGTTLAGPAILAPAGAEERAWPIVRTANPHGGPDLVSAIKVADTRRSDADFAALTLRCREGRMEVVLALIVPVPPRERPEIAWRLDDRAPVSVRASVLQPPTTLGFLPEDAAAFIAAARGARRASFRISNGGTPVTAGEVDLEGVAQTVGALTAQCLAPPR